MSLVIGAAVIAMLASNLLPSAEAGRCNPQGSTTGDPHGFRNPTGDPHDEDDDERGNPHNDCDPDNPPGNGQD
jgi:hypothetical protein